MPVPFDYYSLSGLPAGGLISSVQDMTHYLVAQMNGGRFGSTSVLSSAGIATMHAPGVPQEGGRGQISFRINANMTVCAHLSFDK